MSNSYLTITFKNGKSKEKHFNMDLELLEIYYFNIETLQRGKCSYKASAANKIIHHFSEDKQTN